MLRLKKERRLANKITNMLNKRGFIVEMQFSKRSNSIYLILDNGACPGIRISDHRNDYSKYKFNVIKNYIGKRSEYLNGQVKTFYNFKSIGRLIMDVESERSTRIIKFGYSNYRKIRDKKNFEDLYRKVA